MLLGGCQLLDHNLSLNDISSHFLSSYVRNRWVLSIAHLDVPVTVNASSLQDLCRFFQYLAQHIYVPRVAATTGYRANRLLHSFFHNRSICHIL